MNKFFLFCLLCFVSLGMCFAACSGGESEVSLGKTVLPIIQKECGSCHKRGGNAKAIVNGVYYETKEDLTGKIGKAIIAGDSAKSPLILVMKQEKAVGAGPTLMPPPASGLSKPSDADIATVSSWIDQGAKDN